MAVKYLLGLCLGLVAGPAMAAGLICKVETTCPDGADCAPPESAEEITLQGTEGDAPVLTRAGAQIAVKPGPEGAVRRWSGKNAEGQTEVLALRVADNAFTGLVIFQGATLLKTTGTCEVQ